MVVRRDPGLDRSVGNNRLAIGDTDAAPPHINNLPMAH